MKMPMDKLKPSIQPIPVTGMFSNGNSGGFGAFGNSGQIMVSGTLKLLEGGEEVGTRIVGEMSLTFMQNKGGFMDGR